MSISIFCTRPGSAIVDEGAVLGERCRVWHFVHISGGARIGQGCSFGQNVYVGNDVRIGDHVKVQNNVSVYDAVTLEDEVFYVLAGVGVLRYGDALYELRAGHCVACPAGTGVCVVNSER